jgi:hypothetical protein
MRRRSRHQLVLDLESGGRTLPPSTAPEGLLTALADLLLEAFGKQNNAIPVERERLPLPRRETRSTGPLQLTTP